MRSRRRPPLMLFYRYYVRQKNDVDTRTFCCFQKKKIRSNIFPPKNSYPTYRTTVAEEGIAGILLQPPPFVDASSSVVAAAAEVVPPRRESRAGRHVVESGQAAHARAADCRRPLPLLRHNRRRRHSASKGRRCCHNCRRHQSQHQCPFRVESAPETTKKKTKRGTWWHRATNTHKS